MRAPRWLPWKRHAVDADVTALVTVMCVSCRWIRPPLVCFFVTQIRNSGKKNLWKKNDLISQFFILVRFFFFFFKPHQCTRLLPRSGWHLLFVAKKTDIVVFIYLFYTACNSSVKPLFFKISFSLKFFFFSQNILVNNTFFLWETHRCSSKNTEVIFITDQ